MTQHEITPGSAHGLADTEAFIQSLDASINSLPGEWRDLFGSNREVIITRAPGRIDLMGGFGDYWGSYVLQWPICAAAHVASQRNSSEVVRIASVPPDGGAVRLFEMKTEELHSLTDYDRARTFFSKPEDQWAAYVAGAFVVLRIERDFSLEGAVSLLIHSNVPEGKGLASSAALEVASMTAIAGACGLEIEPRELALLCQKVENLVVGAPCGIMDQLTSVFGESNRALKILCQPAEVHDSIELPNELEIWGIDSGIRHSIGGSDYGTVRIATFMGYRIISGLAGLQVHPDEREGHVAIEDPKWNGYLANISPAEFKRDYEAHLPERISGKDFLERFGGISDSRTSVVPDRHYPVRAATSHPVYENARVNSFAQLLESRRDAEAYRSLGKLMLQAHQSYSSCGIGSAGTDRLVALALAASEAGVYGAKITGGGSGGSVAILGQRGRGEVIQQIARRYREETGNQTMVISGSSPGTNVFGHLRVRLS
jgi:galactokinase